MSIKVAGDWGEGSASVCQMQSLSHISLASGVWDSHLPPIPSNNVLLPGHVKNARGSSERSVVPAPRWRSELLEVPAEAEPGEHARCLSTYCHTGAEDVRIIKVGH